MPDLRQRFCSQAELLQRFSGSSFTASGECQATTIVRRKVAMRERIRQECPSGAGVYGMVDEAGQIVYAGMSVNLAKRLQSYFSSSKRRKKETRIAAAAKTIIWQPLPHELVAKMRERELIRDFKPVMNVQARPTRMAIGFVILTSDPAPMFKVVANIPAKHAGWWGPVSLTPLMKQAVEKLNLYFKLRDCPAETPMLFSNQATPHEIEAATACIRADLNTCLAPCIGACSSLVYANRLRQAKSFLNGKSLKIIDELTAAMQAAAADRNFEQAAISRDQLKSFEQINRYLRRFHDWTSKATFLYRVQSDLTNTEAWVVVVRGNVIDVIEEPLTTTAKLAVARRLDELRNAKMCDDQERFDAARVLFRWFRDHPQEKRRRMSFNAAARKLSPAQRRKQA